MLQSFIQDGSHLVVKFITWHNGPEQVKTGKMDESAAKRQLLTEMGKSKKAKLEHAGTGSG